MSKLSNVFIDGVSYPVNITYKRIKNIHFRYKDGCFEVSCNKYVSTHIIEDFLLKNGKKMIQRDTKNNAVDENFIYIFGIRYNLISPICIGKDILYFSNLSDLNTQLKELLLEYVKNRLFYYYDLMNINESYKVRIKDNSRVLGSNSRLTKSMSFSSNLIHFSPEIIDSVIVHECAHCFVFNHSHAFYKVVYRYCPNYNLYRKKLINSVFA